MWLKWMIPLALGALAAGLNYMAGQSRLEPEYYVAVKQRVEPGEKFTPEMLEKLPLPANQAGLKESAILYRHRAVLYGKVCARHLSKGDIVLWRDSNPPPQSLTLEKDELAITIRLDSKVYFPPFVKVGDEIGFMVAVPQPDTPKSEPVKASKQEFEYVGPFRLVGIDRVFTREDPERSSVSVEGEITVAFRLDKNKKPDANTTRLLQARLQRQTGAAGGIEALVLHAHRPKQEKEKEKTKSTK